MQPLWAGMAVLMAALPMGANGFIIAHQYGVYAKRNSAAILVSTAVLLISLSVIFTVWDRMLAS